MKALVTGFEAYGSHSSNPASEVARALDGSLIDNLAVTGVELPANLAQAGKELVAHIERVRPDITLCLGLWPGEPMIRLERVALNCLDFEIPDSTGLRIQGGVLEADGPDALRVTLAIDKARNALLEQGIPARLSGTAGTYLCNATLYHLLRYAQRERPTMRAGFLHLPYLPQQVAQLLQELRTSAALELHQRADLASMALSTMLTAVRTVLAVSATSIS
jgi:pyroglutamyl-peptidase